MTPPPITPRDMSLAPAGDLSFDSAAHARAMLRAARTAALGTLDAGSCYPFVSNVSLATGMDGAPLMLISRTALHTRNILADSRVSLLVAQGSPARPGSVRLTLTGRAERTEDADARRRFLACHPKLTLPASLPGFAVFRVAPDGLDLVGGPRLALDLVAADLLTDLRGAEALVAGEAALVARLNTEHASLIRSLATERAGQAPGPWRAACVDPDGIDIRMGEDSARILLPRRVTAPEAVCVVLREMAVGGAPMARG